MKMSRCRNCFGVNICNLSNFILLTLSYIKEQECYLFPLVQRSSNKVIVTDNISKTRDRQVYFRFYQPVFVPVHKNNTFQK